MDILGYYILIHKMSIDNTVGKTIKLLRESKSLSQQALANKIKMPRSTISAIENGRFEPSVENLRVFAEFFDVTVDHLVYNGKKTISQKVLTVTVDSLGDELIDLIPIHAQAGYIDEYNNPLFLEDLPKVQIPNIPSGTFRAFQITGDSMPPINQGFIVIGKYVDGVNDISSNKCYIIVSKDNGVVFKRVLKSENSSDLILFSDNSAYTPYPIEKENILEIWAFHCFIGYPDSYNTYSVDFMFNRLNRIETMVAMLSHND